MGNNVRLIPNFDIVWGEMRESIPLDWSEQERELLGK